MIATAPTGTTRPAPDKTVRLRSLGRPVPNVDEATTLLPSARVPSTPLPKAISAFDSKTVRMRPVDLPVIGSVAKTVRQRYVDLSTTASPPNRWAVARVLLVLALAAMPILGISADVFGLVPQNISWVVIIALTAVLAAIVVFAPHRIDMIVGRGLIAGMVACIVYDAARLFAVHVLRLMGDFIPVMGSWVTGEPDTAGSAAVGYVWRYIGDGGGLGVAFFVVAFALGIDRWKSVYAVLACVVFAVFPTWTGLIATVALAPRGEEMMFALNPATVTITLLGHVIFGLVLGLAFLKAPRGRERSEWPWPPILQSAKVRRFLPPAWRATHRQG
jgi:MFS family permease